MDYVTKATPAVGSGEETGGGFGRGDLDREKRTAAFGRGDWWRLLPFFSRSTGAMALLHFFSCSNGGSSPSSEISADPTSCAPSRPDPAAADRRRERIFRSLQRATRGGGRRLGERRPAALPVSRPRLHREIFPCPWNLDGVVGTNIFRGDL